MTDEDLASRYENLWRKLNEGPEQAASILKGLSVEDEMSVGTHFFDSFVERIVRSSLFDMKEAKDMLLRIAEIHDDSWYRYGQLGYFLELYAKVYIYGDVNVENDQLEQFLMEQILKREDGLIEMARDGLEDTDLLALCNEPNVLYKLLDNEAICQATARKLLSADLYEGFVLNVITDEKLRAHTSLMRLFLMSIREEGIAQGWEWAHSLIVWGDLASPPLSQEILFEHKSEGSIGWNSLDPASFAELVEGALHKNGWPLTFLLLLCELKMLADEDYTLDINRYERHYLPFDLFGVPEFAGLVEGLTNSLPLNSLLSTSNEVREELRENLLEMSILQLSRGGPTVFFNIDRLSTQSAAVFIPELLERRAKEAEGIPVHVYGQCMDLRHVATTEFGLRLLQGHGLWMIADVKVLPSLQQSANEAGVGLNVIHPMDLDEKLRKFSEYQLDLLPIVSACLMDTADPDAILDAINSLHAHPTGVSIIRNMMGNPYQVYYDKDERDWLGIHFQIPGGLLACAEALGKIGTKWAWSELGFFNEAIYDSTYRSRDDDVLREAGEELKWFIEDIGSRIK